MLRFLWIKFLTMFWCVLWTNCYQLYKMWLYWLVQFGFWNMFTGHMCRIQTFSTLFNCLFIIFYIHLSTKDCIILLFITFIQFIRYQPIADLCRDIPLHFQVDSLNNKSLGTGFAGPRAKPSCSRPLNVTTLRQEQE